MPPKKEEPKQDTFIEIVLVLVIVLFVWLVWLRLEAYLEYINAGSYTTIWAALLAWFISIRPEVIVLSSLVTLAALYGIISNLRKIHQIAEEENKIYRSPVTNVDDTSGEPKNERWNRVIEHLNSANPSDWRQAVIEADIMLGELLEAQGYHGEGIGEMLKAVDKSDFLTLDAAWEAHKVRNQIAHEGADFDLTEREAKRVIALFELVFQEFKII